MIVNAEVDMDDVLAELSDDEFLEIYNDRFGGRRLEDEWRDIYEKRRAMTVADFLMHLDKIIMDKTGRIV